DFKTNRFNLFIVALSVGFGLIPLVAPDFFKKLLVLAPSWGPILHSGIILTAITSVLLNVFFNGLGDREEAMKAAARTTHGSE
ncbi:MAG: purine permease, partial [Hyphomicrobiaceae bacterium]|nr:purine permease [Hyphomicrobiaceae bacterium]